MFSIIFILLYCVNNMNYLIQIGYLKSVLHWRCNQTNNPASSLSQEKGARASSTILVMRMCACKCHDRTDARFISMAICIWGLHTFLTFMRNSITDAGWFDECLCTIMMWVRDGFTMMIFKLWVHERWFSCDPIEWTHGRIIGCACLCYVDL